MASVWLNRLSHAPRLAGRFLRWGRPRRVLLFGPLSLGDDLLCTTVLHEARRRGVPFAMCTARPELFSGNADPAGVLPVDDHYVAALRRLGSQVIQPYYLGRDPLQSDRDILPPHHVAAEMCRLAGLTGTIAIRPYIFLTATERARGTLHPRQIAIHSSGAAAALPYANKEWGAASFAAVAQQLAPDFHLVQVGSLRDPALPVAVDLRGRTTLRETAAILAGSLAFVGLEGFLAHLARAVDCPSTVVFGGRATPAIFGYSANRNFYTPTPCAPCGLRDTCPHDRLCMTNISSKAVALAARDLANRPRSPLVIDEITL